MIILNSFAEIFIRLSEIMNASDSITMIYLSLFVDFNLIRSIKWLIDCNYMLLQLLISYNISYDCMI
jgi:hypothetical protein